MIKAINDMIIVDNIKTPTTKNVNVDLSFENTANNYPIMPLCSAMVVVADYLSVHRVLKNSFGKPLCKPGDTVYFQKEKVLKFQLPNGSFITSIIHKDVLFIDRKNEK